MNYLKQSIKNIITGIAILSLPVFLMSSLPVLAKETRTQNQSCSFPLQITNWSLFCQLPKFNPILGSLKSVEINIVGSIESDVKVENKDFAAANITSSVSGHIELYKPDNSPLLLVLPSISETDSFTSFDGTVDYVGTSGKIYSKITATTNQSLNTTDAGNLSLFTGTGNINLPITATGNSNFDGAANLATEVDTKAEATVDVIYSYDVQDLAVNTSHTGFFTENINGQYTISVTNNDSGPTEGVLTVVNTIPVGLTYISNSNPNWLCSAISQILTCTSSSVISAGATDSLVITAVAASSSASQVVNQASVSSIFVDPNLADNTATDSIIINHLPIAFSQNLNLTSNQTALKLPLNTLSGNSSDINDSIINYQITSLPNLACGTLYLGNPANGGTAVNILQFLNSTEINNLYFEPTKTCTQTVSFNYLTQDSFLTWSLEPATINILFYSAQVLFAGTTVNLKQIPNILNNPLSKPNSVNALVAEPETNSNSTIASVETIKPTVLSATQTAVRNTNELIRTGSVSGSKAWLNPDLILISEFTIALIFFIYCYQITRKDNC